MSTARIDPERQQALRWLVGQLRWEQWLDDVRRGDTPAADQRRQAA
jgi:hypothetical protein